MRFQLLRHGVLEKDVTTAFELRIVFAFLAANFVDCVVYQADYMKFVEGDLRIGQAGGDSLGEGFRHVGADFGDGLMRFQLLRHGISAVRLEIIGESGDG